MQGSGNIEKYKDVVLEIQVYATKAYAFIEKLSFKAMLAKWWMPNKAESKFDEFSCKFFDQKVQMNQVHELVILVYTFIYMYLYIYIYYTFPIWMRFLIDI